jgi:hypothetical protein
LQIVLSGNFQLDGFISLSHASRSDLSLLASSGLESNKFFVSMSLQIISKGGRQKKQILESITAPFFPENLMQKQKFPLQRLREVTGILSVNRDLNGTMGRIRNSK